MCGRYASSRGPEELIEVFEVAADRTGARLDPDFNVAPTKPVYAVVARPPSGTTDPPQRQLRVLRWGLVPSWAKDPRIGNRLINARMETLAEKPAFRKALAARRCLLPADGYFEWYPTRTPSGKPAKQPFFIHPADGGVLAMAGLYEIWRDPARAEDDPDRFWWTCTIITTAAPDELGQIHDRMPLMVEKQQWSEWLDPRDRGSMELLVPAAPGRLEAYPVGGAVGNVANNGPDLIVPLPPEAGQEPR